MVELGARGRGGVGAYECVSGVCVLVYGACGGVGACRCMDVRGSREQPTQARQCERYDSRYEERENSRHEETACTCACCTAVVTSRARGIYVYV